MNFRFATGVGERSQHPGLPVVTYVEMVTLASKGSTKWDKASNDVVMPLYSVGDMCRFPTDQSKDDSGALHSITLTGIKVGGVAYTYKLGITTG